MANRKRNARPGIFKRGSTWSYQLSYQDEVTGKYRQRWVGGYKNQTEAWNAKLEALSKRNAGEDLRPDQVTVAAYLKRWLSDYAKGLPGDRTHDGYESLFTNHVIPAIGNVKLRKLRPLQVQAVYTRMRGPLEQPCPRCEAKPAGCSRCGGTGKVTRKGLSEKTILNCHRVLSEALKHAVDWEITSRNVAGAAKKPKPERYEAVIMPIEMVREALELAHDGTVGGAVVRYAIYSGMRQGELRRLQRDHVQLEILHSSIPKAKTRRGVRGLSLTIDGAAVLREQLVQRARDKDSLGPSYKDGGYVFARPDGTPLSETQCNWAWGKIRRKLETKARFHDLRHAHASLLLMMGVHPKLVQERLGHASIQVTIDLYSHVMPGIHAAAVLPLDELLHPSRSKFVAEPMEAE